MKARVIPAAPFVLLVILTGFDAGLVVPIGTVPKFRLAGATVTGANPVPVKPTKPRKFPEPSVTVIAPVIFPAAVGAKKAEILQ